MNDYCANCGRKLEKEELICKECNTPIIDYDYKLSKETMQNIKIIIIIGSFILCVITFFFLKIIIHNIKVDKMQNEYIEPYLKENYSSLNYSIKYNSSGKCIISGDCYFDPMMGYDGGGMCQVYEYLDDRSCKSYYYFIESDSREFILTVVNKDNKFFVVEGRNIYGNDKEIGYVVIINDSVNDELNYNSD